MTSSPVAQPHATLQALREWADRHVGIQFKPEQYELFEMRLRSLADDLGVDLDTLAVRVYSGDRATVIRLAEAVSTNHTFFFREPEMFDLLGQEILPSLADAAQIRIWSAACSSGDEAYSIAICAHERLGDRAGRVRVLGTDISERQVRAAERGLYPLHQLVGVGPRLRDCFTSVGVGHFEVLQKYRDMCMFRRMNLTLYPWPFEQAFHVIFLRNVLYYFAPDVCQRVLDTCYDFAEPGAWLITSLTEPMVDVQTRWSRVRPAVFRKEAP